MLIKRLQGYARQKNLRVIFISGDVHVGGLGRLYTHPKMDLRQDFRFMPQVISRIPPALDNLALMYRSSLNKKAL